MRSSAATQAATPARHAAARSSGIAGGSYRRPTRFNRDVRPPARRRRPAAELERVAAVWTGWFTVVKGYLQTFVYSKLIYCEKRLLSVLLL
jgi:hypothetical protein